MTPLSYRTPARIATSSFDLESKCQVHHQSQSLVSILHLTQITRLQPYRPSKTAPWNTPQHPDRRPPSEASEDVTG